MKIFIPDSEAESQDAVDKIKKRIDDRQREIILKSEEHQRKILEKLNKFMVGREIEMRDLKERIKIVESKKQ